MYSQEVQPTAPTRVDFSRAPPSTMPTPADYIDRLQGTPKPRAEGSNPSAPAIFPPAQVAPRTVSFTN
jgi:hypothetical protein